MQVRLQIKKVFQSQGFARVLKIIAGIFVLLLIFGTGVRVGFRKANFSYRWGENYHRNFGGPRHGWFHGLDADEHEFMNAHGTAGSILQVDVSGGTLVVKGKDNTERTILISAQTVIQKNRVAQQIADLKADDRIVVIGTPNAQGQIEAKFIRVFPQ